MAVSISAVVLLGIIVFALIRGGTVRLGSALICAAFGFFLASTGAAPLITETIGTVTGWISSL
ncbi:hypothetical protein RM863_38840 [Streptomyces sp. DSM 41014]|uniref:Uncharacterized protein n=2 Tax=Streptomyces TaxID=1883 RepID=A0ABU2W7R9_9ACTN|nr:MULTISPECIES: hypothetical protein [Streptomyces]MDT0478084.1 hypothetical protein [Streptomyces sp. DSM 41014]MDT0493664.1 hypothetical protein [Streptomyces griseus]